MQRRQWQAACASQTTIALFPQGKAFLYPDFFNLLRSKSPYKAHLCGKLFQSWCYAEGCDGSSMYMCVCVCVCVCVRVCACTYLLRLWMHLMEWNLNFVLIITLTEIEWAVITSMTSEWRGQGLWRQMESLWNLSLYPFVELFLYFPVKQAE